MNEGGTFGERVGWHLPGFDDSTWATTNSLAMEEAGVRVFRTTFDLDLPSSEADVAISFNFPPAPIESGEGYRAWLYVNGWNMGRYVADMGVRIYFYTTFRAFRPIRSSSSHKASSQFRRES